ncbi:MAG: C-GCAxxG-C-C family protein [Nitrospirota bacterium]
MMSLAYNEVVKLNGQLISCTSAILSTYGGYFGISREVGLKVPAALGLGLCMGETCGAVIGVMMLIGAKHGKTRGDDYEADQKLIGHVVNFLQDFGGKNKTLKCRELLNFDATTPEGFKEALETGLFARECPKYLKQACDYVEKNLL